MASAGAAGPASTHRAYVSLGLSVPLLAKSTESRAQYGAVPQPTHLHQLGEFQIMSQVLQPAVGVGGWVWWGAGAEGWASRRGHVLPHPAGGSAGWGWEGRRVLQPPAGALQVGVKARRQGLVAAGWPAAPSPKVLRACVCSVCPTNPPTRPACWCHNMQELVRAATVNCQQLFMMDDQIGWVQVS